VRAIETLRQASAVAAPLGDQAYEIRIISSLLLGDLLPFHGQVTEAEAAFETVLTLAREHGDQFHVMAAYVNRRQLWLGRQELERAVEDTRRASELAREIGLPSVSFMCEYNLGELLYQGGDADAAWEHVQRAVDLEVKRFSGLARPVARLLAARLLAYQGRTQEARRFIDDISAYSSEAKRQGDAEAQMLPSEQVLFFLVDLCTREATAAEWEDLRARAGTASVEQEPIEVAEVAALALGRTGQTELARRMLDDALALARKIPNVMEKRLRQSQEQLQAGPVSHAS
jgi:ATP/maltotriose-dependent transcriptional regulator MalT